MSYLKRKVLSLGDTSAIYFDKQILRQNIHIEPTARVGQLAVEPKCGKKYKCILLYVTSLIIRALAKRLKEDKQIVDRFTWIKFIVRLLTSVDTLRMWNEMAPMECPFDTTSRNKFVMLPGSLAMLSIKYCL